MPKKVELHGIDGKVYDNHFDLVRGNQFAMMEQEKAKDLKKQNELLESSMLIQKQIADQNYMLEMEKEQNRIKIEEQKIEHEKEMRLLKLFDDVGISKSIYDEYINNNFCNSDVNKIVSEKSNVSLEIEKLKFVLNEQKNIEELGWDSFYSTMKKYNMYEIKEKFESKATCSISKEKQKERNILESKRKKSLIVSIISFIIPFIFLIPGIFSNEYDDEFIGGDIYIYIALISFSVCLISFFIFYRKYKLDLSRYPSEEIDYKKYNSLLKNEINTLENKKASIEKDIEKRLFEVVNKFNNFRINNYNSKVEKLFRDVGLVDLFDYYGLEYKSVNSSNKKGNGEVESYISFFEENS